MEPPPFKEPKVEIIDSGFKVSGYEYEDVIKKGDEDEDDEGSNSITTITAPPIKRGNVYEEDANEEEEENDDDEEEEEEIDIGSNRDFENVPQGSILLSQGNAISGKGVTKLVIGGDLFSVDLNKVHTLTELMQQSLIENGDSDQATRHIKIMKDVVLSHGLKIPDVKETFKQFFAEHLAKEGTVVQLSLAYRLLSSHYLEEKYSALLLLEKNIKHLGVRFFVCGDFEFFLRNYIYDWSTCDTFSSRIVFTLLKKDEAVVSELVRLKNLPDATLWMLRCCCVSFVKLARFGKLNDVIIDICSTAVRNSERFVQLGAGWVLRELSRADLNLVIQFIRQNIKFISKEGLRYATEKMTSDVKYELMDYKRIAG